MSEASQSVYAEDNTPKATKDKNCPFCGQAFTSSSLGRHLDLYIKERNPKKPDGIHIVDEIRKLRGGVTRRQGLARRRHASMPAGTASLALHKQNKASELGGSSVAVTPTAKESSNGTDNGAARLTSDFLSAFPMGRLRWEATGVMNEVIDKLSDPRGRTDCVNSDGGGNADSDAGIHADADADAGEGGGEDADATAGVDVDVHSKPKEPHLHSRPVRSGRVLVKQAAKVSLDTGKSFQETVHTARAAELALRELVQCLRAADYATEIGLRPFEFDPLTMNFPALTLRCLRAQPTLFASTQLATPSSWSTAPPGTSQFEALQAFFKETFRTWKVKCAAATTVQLEEFPYPPPPPPPTVQPVNRNQAILRAMKRADALEEEVNRHLEMAFSDWEQLPLERRTELWVLELARGLATKQTEVEHFRNDEARMKQEVANLKIQIAQLNRLQQPREFKIMPPAHLLVDERVLFTMQDNAVSQNSHMVGLNLGDRHSDINTIVSSSISRWKKVLTQQRGSPYASAGTGAGASAPTAMTVAHLSTVASPCDSTSPLSGKGPAASLLGSLRGRKNLRRGTRSSVSTATVRTATVPAVALQQHTHGMRGREKEDSHSSDGDDVGSEHDGGTNGDADTSGPSGLPGQAARIVPVQNTEEVETGGEVRDGFDGGASNSADNDKMSDKDADAETDGDAFSHMHTPISRSIDSFVGAAAQASQQLQKPHRSPLLQQHPQQATSIGLRAPRTHGAVQKKSPDVLAAAAGGNPTDSLLPTSHPIPSMNAIEMDGFSLVDLDMPALDGDVMYTE